MIVSAGNDVSARHPPPLIAASAGLVVQAHLDFAVDLLAFE